MDLLPENINTQCEELTLNREVRVFKDPELLRENLKMLAEDPQMAREHINEERPLITTRKGRVKVCYGEAELFRGYRKLLALYPKELYLPLSSKNEIPKIMKVRFSGGSDAYFNNLGFVFASEFQKALEESPEGSLPPSLKIIPKLNN